VFTSVPSTRLDPTQTVRPRLPALMAVAGTSCWRRDPKYPRSTHYQQCTLQPESTVALGWYGKVDMAMVQRVLLTRTPRWAT
jgi:hypothetical protein